MHDNIVIMILFNRATIGLSVSPSISPLTPYW